jgi:hypothetical protein
MATGDRVSRPLTELFEHLEKHTSLLREDIEGVRRDGDTRRLGDIATRVRMLVLRTRTNVPLLLELARITRWRLTVSIPRAGVGPGEIPFETEYSGKTLTVDEWLDTETFYGQVTLTRRQLAFLWAVNIGAAHEDWALDPRLFEARESGGQMKRLWDELLGPGLGVLPLSLDAEALVQIAETVLSSAEQFLAVITPARIHAAEGWRQDELRDAS